MCGMCGVPAPPGLWSDTGVLDNLRDRLRARIRRAELIDRVLRHHGLRASDSLVAPGLALSSPTGGHALAHDLESVWVEAERMCGRRIDPLDVGLLDALASQGVDAGQK